MRGRRVRGRIPGSFFTCSGSNGGRTDVGAVHQPQVPVDFALLIQANSQRLENAVEGAIASPAVEAVVDAFPFSVPFGQVTPRCAGAENPQHAVKHGAMIVPSSAASLFGEQSLDEIPMSIAQLISGHMSSMTRTLCAIVGKRAIPNMRRTCDPPDRA